MINFPVAASSMYIFHHSTSLRPSLVYLIMVYFPSRLKLQNFTVDFLLTIEIIYHEMLLKSFHLLLTYSLSFVSSNMEMSSAFTKKTNKSIVHRTEVTK